MLRVIQWATGNVGRHAVAAVHDHPDLALVGALVYSDAKAGRDVGELCGIGEIGVVATKDPEQILALDADCVLYMPQGEMNPMGALDDICRLLASGKNVVSTAVTPFIYPRSAGRAVVDRLEAACAEGGHVLSRHRHRARAGRPRCCRSPCRRSFNGSIRLWCKSFWTTRATTAPTCCSTSWVSARRPTRR